MKSQLVVAALLALEVEAKHHHHHELAQMDLEAEAEAEIDLNADVDEQIQLANDLEKFNHFLVQKDGKHHHLSQQAEGEEEAAKEAEEAKEAESSSTDQEKRQERLKNHKHRTNVNVYMPVKRAYANKPDSSVIKSWGKKKAPRAQTVASILKAAEDAKHTAEELNKRGKDLGDLAKEKRAAYDKKQETANESAREVSEFNAKARELKARLTRSIRRLETVRHEAVHDAHKQAQADVDKEKRDHADLKSKAKEEAEAAAAKEGASASLAISSAAKASQDHGLADVEGGSDDEAEE
jgi:DNA repair exonuclease SbcCD ATPase subunit